ncbi:MAG TPA: hypothetical protein ENK18_20160 [Deltaproteobacteria bacterium]|nr:hypothetical protein [Deltaproteobacteria bacterium]
MIGWLCLLGLATAGELSGWIGAWGIDPVESDDPYLALERAVRAPLLSAGSARQMAPDRGASDLEAARARVLEEMTRMLNRSGRLDLAEDEDGKLVVGFGGDTPVAVELGRGWARIKEDTGVLKVRAWRSGEHLSVERRLKTTSLTETLLPPEDPELLYVVVRIAGSGMEGLEFRRVYRALDPPDPALPEPPRAGATPADPPGAGGEPPGPPGAGDERSAAGVERSGVGVEP